ncbi:MULTISPECIES: glycosyltransferase family 87 protein [Aphanothece]|uniref:glycosyltransferase family 87 protein n=1 Tax=Aphanothece TaxID=1121 RepID=UPI003984F158
MVTALSIPSDPERSQPTWVLIGSALLLVGGSLLMAPHGQLTDPLVLGRFWPAAAVMAGGFALSWRLEAVGRWAFWGVALAARLLLLPMEPSDDIWRYLWEGQIQLLGFNPFELPPADAALAAWRPPWWALINHPDVTAIYPPLTQLLFRLLALPGPSVLVFKLAFVAADLGVCALLVRRFGRRRSLLYGWNPLILVSFAGGGHFDSWFLLPLAAAWTLGPRQRLAAALLVGLSVAIKWISLPMLAHQLWQPLRARRWRQALAMALLGLLPMAAASLAFCDRRRCALVPMGSSFVRHGRSAELVPHLVGRVWSWSVQHNGVFLLALAAVTLLLLGRRADLGRFSRRYLLALLLLSPIVHVWYFSWLIPFGLPTRAWAERLVSLSGFVYFVLPSRLPDWQLSDAERLLLWGPLVAGLALEALAAGGAPADDQPDDRPDAPSPPERP